VRGQRHAPVAFYPRKDPVPIVQEAGWATGPVCTGAENLAPIWIRSPDCPVRSQSLYRLSSVAIPTELHSPLFLHYKQNSLTVCGYSFPIPRSFRYKSSLNIYSIYILKNRQGTRTNCYLLLKTILNELKWRILRVNYGVFFTIPPPMLNAIFCFLYSALQCNYISFLNSESNFRFVRPEKKLKF
jgi:hypothetical protein